ncbi:MAG: amino acid adenylation domain-containing protein [Planctomycetota bacterium]|nr:amino acid adenylation domain-containing protein [Planctomycetota bacterium]
MPNQDVESFYPLSPLQQGLLFHSISEPGSGMYFNQTAVELRGDLNAEALHSAWQQAVDEHAILRTFFVWEGVESPIQVVRKKAQMPFSVVDWTGRDEMQQQSALDTLRQEDLQAGFDLSKAPLVRATLIRRTADSWCLFWSFHHILMDGWSMFTMLGQVFGAYDAACAGEVYSPEPSRPYRDHIVWLNQQSLSAAEKFWTRNLEGFTAPTPMLSEPGRLPEQSGDDGFTAEVLELDRATSTALQEFASKQHITLNTLLQGAWALMLSRYSGEDDVLFGAVVSGRPPALEGVEAMVGLFINTLPVRVKAPETEQVLPWLQRLQAEQAELREYDYSPLVEIQGWSEVPRGDSLFQSIFLFENYKKDAPLEDLCKGLEIGEVQWFERHNFPLAAVAIPGEEFMLRLIYQTNVYGSQTIARMLGHWKSLLEAMVANPNQSLSELPMVTQAERQQLVVDWNQTASEYPRDACIHHLFEEHAASAPNAIAVVLGEERLTYGELNARANRLAHHLKRMGVGPEVVVGLCMDRSTDLTVALLAILKAGGAYLSLDPEYPKERLRHMLRDTRAPVLLTKEHLVTELPDNDALTVCLDADAEAIGKESDQNPEGSASAEQLAYVIYTSGSTGLPKGTLIPHRAVVRLVRNTNFANFDADEVFLQFATVSFDASTLELWASLLNGARLVLFPTRRTSLEELGQVIQEHGVTTLWLTAGLFHQMVEQHVQGLQGVRQLIAGGDVLSVSHVKQALNQIEGCRVINGYGPTENTTFTCCHPMMDSEDVGQAVPIGRPIANTTVFILDGQLRPVPIGVIGDLYAGGDGLARGYLNQPELTAERFIESPFSDKPGDRLYQVGDKARYLADGTIEFLGRSDSQVKLRGYRIELAEIETVLNEHDSIRDVVVAAREDTPGDKRLVAYLIATGDNTTDASSLREFLGGKLPDYMVPAAFMTLDEFPLTANGKVDRKALPAPEPDRSQSGASYTPPGSELEKIIAEIWQGVLKVDEVGTRDNFFDLGGHSLSLIRVHGAIQKHLGRKIPMVEMFRFPTVGALAVFLAGGAETQEGKPAAGPSSEDLKAGRSRLARMQARRKRPGS